MESGLEKRETKERLFPHCVRNAVLETHRLEIEIKSQWPGFNNFEIITYNQYITHDKHVIHSTNIMEYICRTL
jgi:hypothetical protein